MPLAMNCWRLKRRVRKNRSLKSPPYPSLRPVRTTLTCGAELRESAGEPADRRTGACRLTDRGAGADVEHVGRALEDIELHFNRHQVLTGEHRFALGVGQLLPQLRDVAVAVR